MFMISIDGIDDKIKIIIASAIDFPIPEIVSGVYLLFDKDELVYVGKSMDVIRRLKEHKAKKFDSMKIIKCSDETSSFLERLLIEYYFPKYNIDGYTKKLKAIFALRETRIIDFINKLEK
jgi:excinuclease UvrABC nuclease subunit